VGYWLDRRSAWSSSRTALHTLAFTSSSLAPHLNSTEIRRLVAQPSARVMGPIRAPGSEWYPGKRQRTSSSRVCCSCRASNDGERPLCQQTLVGITRRARWTGPLRVRTAWLQACARRRPTEGIGLDVNLCESHGYEPVSKGVRIIGLYVSHHGAPRVRGWQGCRRRRRGPPASTLADLSKETVLQLGRRDVWQHRERGWRR